MNKESIKIIKWGTVSVLALSAIFFFLPYRGGISPIQVINMANQAGANSNLFIADVLLNFALPVVLTLLAALMMALRTSIPKCIFAVVFCLLATAIYSTLGDSDAEIGLIGNRIIAIAGIILPIVNIVLTKVFLTDKNTNIE